MDSGWSSVFGVEEAVVAVSTAGAGRWSVGSGWRSGGVVRCASADARQEIGLDCTCTTATTTLTADGGVARTVHQLTRRYGIHVKGIAGNAVMSWPVVAAPRAPYPSERGI